MLKRSRKYHFMISGLKTEPAELDYKASLTYKIQELGGIYHDGPSLKSDCTHLICARLTKSEKVLSAMAKGRWILTPQFVENSFEKKEWQNESRYEWTDNHLPDQINSPALVDLYNAAKKNRKKVDLFQNEIFHQWKVALVANSKGIKAAYRRILHAGGARIFPDIIIKSSRISEATHIFVCPDSKADVQNLLKRNILCVSTDYIRNYLLMAKVPDLKDFDIRTYVANSDPFSRVGAESPITIAEKHHCFSNKEKKMVLLLPKLPVGSPGKKRTISDLPPPGESPPKRQKLNTETVEALAVTGFKNQENNVLKLKPLKPSENNVVFSTSVQSDCKHSNFSNENEYSTLHQFSKLVHIAELQAMDLHKSRLKKQLLYPEYEKECTPYDENLESTLSSYTDDQYWDSAMDVVISTISSNRYPPASFVNAAIYHTMKQPISQEVAQHCYRLLMTLLEMFPPENGKIRQWYCKGLSSKNLFDGFWDMFYSSIRTSIDKSGKKDVIYSHTLLLDFLEKLLTLDFRYFLTKTKNPSRDFACKATQPLIVRLFWGFPTKFSSSSNCSRFFKNLAYSFTRREFVKTNRKMISILKTLLECVRLSDVTDIHDQGSPNTDAVVLVENILANALTDSEVRQSKIQFLIGSVNLPWVNLILGKKLLEGDDGLELIDDGQSSLQSLVQYYYQQGSHTSLSSDSDEGFDDSSQSLSIKFDSDNDDSIDQVPAMKRNMKGETQLHTACMKNKAEVVKRLLSIPEVDINAKDNAGWTALHEACNHGHTECVKLLLTFKRPFARRGAFSFNLPSKINPTIKSNCGVTPLEDAIMNDQAEAVELMLKHCGKRILNKALIKEAHSKRVKTLLKDFMDSETPHEQCKQFKRHSFFARHIVTSYIQMHKLPVLFTRLHESASLNYNNFELLSRQDFRRLESDMETFPRLPEILKETSSVGVEDLNVMAMKLSLLTL